MNVHKNARLTPLRRGEMALSVIEGRLTYSQAARFYGVTSKIVRRWEMRYRSSGAAGMSDRSSRPQRLPGQTPQALVDQVLVLRRQRLTGRHIAREAGLSTATISRILRRFGLNRLRHLEPAEPPRRYQRDKPGELIHLDIKKLGKFSRVGHRITRSRAAQPQKRGAGWEFVHVCIDDASRIAYTDIMPDEKAVSAIAFLKACIAYYQSLGVKVTRVMTDNGAGYIARDFAKACEQLGLKHIRTKPYTPKTNGKAERFIQTALREWAYARAYETSEQRKQCLPQWTHNYNWHRPHGGINYKTPTSVLGLTEDNLLRLHI
jgi:transposase InsO family protein